MGTRPPGPGRGNKIPQGNGPGHGVSVARPHVQFQPGHQLSRGIPAISRRTLEERMAIKAAKEERDEAAMAVIEQTMFAADRDEARLAAAIAMLNRTRGLPVATNLNHDGRDVTLEQLVEGSLRPRDEPTE